MRDAAAVAVIDSVRSGTLLREAIAGDSANRRADLLDAATRCSVESVDVSSLPALDIDRQVQQLNERGDALDASARHQDEITAAESPGLLEPLLAELRR